mmetsp:Transcript_80331/g.232078  ORF Transcript_80331/g.232078 Transcript_80331/m.232078 type:complete len:108 (-) Transcript_80331:122-445(-)
MGADASTCRAAAPRCKECVVAAVAGEVPEWSARDGNTPMDVADVEVLKADRIDAWTLKSGDFEAPRGYIADIHEGTEIVMKGTIADVEVYEQSSVTDEDAEGARSKS